MKIRIAAIFGLGFVSLAWGLGLLFLSGCKGQSGDLSPQVFRVATLSLSAPDLQRQGALSGSGLGTCLVQVVPGSINSANNLADPSQVLAQGFLDLNNQQVTLTLPLDTSLRLIRKGWSGTYKTAAALPRAEGIGLSGLFSITAQTDQLSLSVPLLEAPALVSQSPADGATQAATSGLTLTFNNPLDSTSLAINLTDDRCTGAFQLSADRFATCVRWGSLAQDSSLKVVSLTPASSLSNSTTYKLKITTQVQDLSGNGLAAELTSGTGFTTVAASSSSTTSSSSSSAASTSSTATASTGSTTAAADTTAPTVSAGTLRTSGVSGIGLTLDWTAATDETTAASALTYQVYYSTANNLGTLAQAKANGTAANSATAGISTLSLSGLAGGTTYYLNVIVTDGAGNQSLYSGTSVTTTAWVQQAYLKASNSTASTNAQYGYALSLYGDTLAVGSPFEDSGSTTLVNGSTSATDTTAFDAGAVFVYLRTGTSWAQQAYIKAINANTGDSFGTAVSVYGDLLAVGARMEDGTSTTIINGATADTANGGVNIGAVYVYARTGTSWAQEAYIKAGNLISAMGFGETVALGTDTLVVGTSGEDSSVTTITNGTTVPGDMNLTYDSGAVYVYRRTGTSWAREAYIKPANTYAGAYFGFALSLSSDTLAVGAYQERSLQTTITNGTTASADISGTAVGAVYVYKRTGTNWAQEAYLKTPNAETGDDFGYSVALSGDSLAVGAPMEDSNLTTITNGATASANNGSSNSGAVYVFKRTGTNWAQEAYLKAVNAGTSDEFGGKVALSGNSLAVTAYMEASNQQSITNGGTASADNSAAYAGAVYVYQRSGASWAQEAYVKSANLEAYDGFGGSNFTSGTSLALGSNTLVVGAPGEDSNQTTITNGTTASADNTISSAGAVYIYLRQ